MTLLRGRRILIVDQTMAISKSLADDFVKDGAQVLLVDNSADAILAVLKDKPDLIISTIEIGKINGFDFAKVIKLMLGLGPIPFVLIGSEDKNGIEKMASELSADYFVAQDGDLSEHIHSVVSKVFSLDKLREIKTNTSQRPTGKVLIADDSSVMRKMVINIIKGNSAAEIVVAENGREALEILRKEKIGLIITDSNMPVMSGEEFIKNVRSCPAYDRLPIVLITSEASEDDIYKYYAAGASDHVVKPFTTEDIQKIINKYEPCIKRI